MAMGAAPGARGPSDDERRTPWRARAPDDPERRYRLIAENASDVVVEIGIDGAIRWASPSIEAMLGRPVDELVGRRLLTWPQAVEALLRHARADHLEAVIDKLQEAGVRVAAEADGIRVASPGGAQLKAQSFRTTEYPGFPTDMQAQFMALNVLAQGTSTVTETIFENRFMHVNELLRLGAHIAIDGREATVTGGAQLSGATVMATDLRASASLVIAGLVAGGETLVDRIYHLDRGYDRMEDKLRGLGADIERISS